MYSALDTFLSHTAINFGPVRCSRFNYVWMFSVVSGFNWIQSTSPIAGPRGQDDWDWTQHQSLPEGTTEGATEGATEGKTDIWMYHVLQFVNSYLILNMLAQTNASGSLLNSTILGLRNITQAELDALSKPLIPCLNEWKTRWLVWYNTRAMDGSSTLGPPTPDSLPNGIHTVNPWIIDQDFSEFPSTSQWASILLNPSNHQAQTYLAYNWQNVKTTCVPNYSTILQTTSALFPTPTERIQEISSLLSTTNQLHTNQEQKMIAELWAGNPGSVTPPGMFLWLWRQYTSAVKVSKNKGDSTFLFSGLDLATKLFETGRIVWCAKQHHMQARPIQEIRNHFAMTPVISYSGSTIPGCAWWPYQISTVITPPFADFPSGHSAFGQIFALTMTEWFGPDIPTISTLRTNQNLFAKGLPPTAHEPFAWFTYPAGASQVEPGVVPARSLTLGKDWATWQDMADSCGMSRQYGGIHANSAHIGSQVLASTLFHTMHWPITKPVCEIPKSNSPPPNTRSPQQSQERTENTIRT